MPGLEAGEVCVKTKGREAGRKCVVLEVNAKDGTALVQGPKVKKRKCNLAHLVPLGKKVSVKKGITKEELQKLIE